MASISPCAQVIWVVFQSLPHFSPFFNFSADPRTTRTFCQKHEHHQ